MSLRFKKTSIDDLIDDIHEVKDMDNIRNHSEFNDLLNSIYELGVLTGLDRSKFKSDDAYKAWKKNKVDHLVVLEEYKDKIVNLMLQKNIKFKNLTYLNTLFPTTDSRNNYNRYIMGVDPIRDCEDDLKYLQNHLNNTLMIPSDSLGMEKIKTPDPQNTIKYLLENGLLPVDSL